MEKYIGCSGFHYAHWKGKFYPARLPKNRWLYFYSQIFNTVEINNTFYRTPEVKYLQNWLKQTPPEFKFTIKVNRYFTHQKALNTDNDFINQLSSFIETVKTLGNQLGCLLWQLPGSLLKDEQKLKNLLECLDGTTDHVIEFRHSSWFTESILSLLSAYDVGCCMLSAPGNLPEMAINTSSIAYLRFHGKHEWYRHLYSEEELKTWFNQIPKLSNPTRFYAYFNNDFEANAVKNARMLMELFDPT